MGKYYLNRSTGEITDNHHDAIDWYRGGDEVEIWVDGEMVLVWEKIAYGDTHYVVYVDDDLYAEDGRVFTQEEEAYGYARGMHKSGHKVIMQKVSTADLAF